MDENQREKRFKYWNDNYRDYWQKRVAESNTMQQNNSQLNQNDKLSSSDQVYFDAIRLLEISPDSNVLEMGCGFGRSISFLSPLCKSVHAIDISDAMIEMAKKLNHFENVTYQVSEAEKTPFPDNTFNHIVCFAVFDAVFQTETLKEMNRIMCSGGRLLITGKNDSYYENDHEAYIAEIRAREKGHPNFFTDVHGLLNNLGLFGFQKRIGRFYFRRGDIHEKKFSMKLPKRFYEYFLVLEKLYSAQENIDLLIGNSSSKVWQSKNQKEKNE